MLAHGAAFEDFMNWNLVTNPPMPLHPATQQLINKVEDLSGRLVHVTEDPELKVMATISPARDIAPAHFLRYRPGTRAVD